MIELPDGIVPAEAEVQVVDFGFIQRSPSGAGITRIDRPGNRLRLFVQLPPLAPEVASVVAGRLRRAQGEGLRMTYPLLGVSQGHPGAPVVNGSGAGGTALPLRGLTPGYVAKEGYKLTLIDGDGLRYTHEVTATVSAAGDGTAALTVEPPLRTFPADGCVVLLGKPTIDGLVVSEVPERLPKSRLVTLDFMIEEMD